MEDLAWHYPAEPIERAAIRFCEAVAKWRGKPELETVRVLFYTSGTLTILMQYKKKTKGPTSYGLAMESFVHSNPTSPTANFAVRPSGPKPPQRPSIEKYFIAPHSVTAGRNKRRRSFDEGERFFRKQQ